MIRFSLGGAAVAMHGPEHVLDWARRRLSWAVDDSDVDSSLDLVFGKPGPSAIPFDCEHPNLGRYRVEGREVMAEVGDDYAGIEAALRLAASLALDSGLLVHAAGLVLPGGALLVPAPSGAGKSTIASLSSLPLLSDEVVALSDSVSGTQAWATPLQSSCRRPATPHLRAPLRGLLLIEKADRDALVPAEAMVAGRMLFAQSLGANSALEQRRRFALAWRIASRVPAWILRFRRESAVDRLLESLTP